MIDFSFPSIYLFIYFTGSFSFSVLSGKVMFRDVYFINEDMSIRYTDTLQLFVLYLNPILFYSYLCSVDTRLITVVCLLTIITLFMGYIPSFFYSIVNLCFRIQDGLLIFRWWQMYNPKQKQHGQCKHITNNSQKLWQLYFVAFVQLTCLIITLIPTFL